MFPVIKWKCHRRKSLLDIAFFLSIHITFLNKGKGIREYLQGTVGMPTRKKKKKGKSLKIILGMFSFLSSSLGEIIQILICIWHCDISVSALQSPGLSYPIYKFEVICLSLELSRHFLFSDVSQSLDSVGL